MLTDAELAAIRARAQAATPGPWVTIPPGGPNGPFWSICNSVGNIVALRLTGRQTDAGFIAYARTDIPALLAERGELMAILQHVADYLDLYAVEPIPNPLPGSLEALTAEVLSTLGGSV